MSSRLAALGIAGALAAVPAAQESPAHVDITWMSMANLYYRIGPVGVVTDGYITRIPAAAFYGGPSGLATTREPYRSDRAAVARVLEALGGPPAVDLLLTGHSHWDHSFDTGTWAALTGASVIGSPTTCFQVRAVGVDEARCRPVLGGERITVGENVSMRVVRWNHSGDPVRNPEQHNPVELAAVPEPDRATGGLRAGVAEDFPNGGGSRGYLFVVDGAAGRFSWFQQSTASAATLDAPIIVDGVDYGAPIDNLQAALTDAGLTAIDLWIGTGSRAVAERVLPVLRPAAYLPIHWDGLWETFEDGLARPFADPALEAFLDSSGVALVEPRQFMDSWRLDPEGLHPRANAAAKRALGFPEVQPF